MPRKPLFPSLPGNAITQVVVGVAGIAGLAATYFFIVKPSLEYLGLKETKYDKKLPKQNGFDPEYWKKHLNQLTISTSEAEKIAYEIKMSYGWASSSSNTGTGGWLESLFTAPLAPAVNIASGEYNFGNDDEKRLISAIAACRNETNLSKVSEVFQKKYGIEMIDYIKNFADNADTKRIYEIIKSW